METSAAIFHVQWRRPSTDDRLVSGIAVPWNEISYLTGDDRGEMFAPGSLTRTVKARGDRLKLFRSSSQEHDYGHAVGRAARLDPRHPDGLMSSWRIAQTAAGDEALEEIAEGMLDAFSIRFRPIKSARNAEGARVITEAELVDVSILPVGAYAGATVTEVRSALVSGDRPALAELGRWLADHPAPETNPAPWPDLHGWRP